MLDPVELDIVGALEGSDKATSVQSSWNYLRQYEVLFGEFRHDAVNVIEVGLARGASLKIWKWFFPNATIVGLDINRACTSYAEDRVVIEIGSQADRGFLNRVCGQYPPTVFIDDGSHLAAHNIITFEAVFPHVQPGGLYVVEDLAFHFGPQASRWQTAEIRDAPAYFLDLARHCLSVGRSAEPISTPNKIARSVESVTFVGSAAIIRKSRALRDTGPGIRAADMYLSERPASAEAQVRLAAWIMHHKGSLDRVEQALDTAAAGGEEGAMALLLRGRMLRLQHREAEGAVALNRAIDSISVASPMLRNLARELTECGHGNDAIRAMEKAVALDPDNAMNRAVLADLRRAPPAAHIDT